MAPGMLGPMPRRYQIFCVFLIAYFLSYFFRSTNAVIAEDLTRDIGLTASELGLMTSLFFMAFALAQLPLGSALDRFGSRWVTPSLMLAAVAGSLAFAVAGTFTGLAVGRALIGIGMAGVLMGALKAFAGWFPPRVFATVSSIFVGLGSLGALAAATPLALFSNAFGWRSIFVWGAIATVVSAALIVLWGRNAAQVEAPQVAGGFGDIFRSREFWRIGLLGAAVTGTLFSYQTLWAGPFLSEAMGFDRIGVGNALLAMGVGVTAGYFVIGALGDRFGITRIVGLAAALLCVVQIVLAMADPAWPRVTVVLLFSAFGLAGSASVLFFAHSRAVFPSTPGRAVTAVNLFGIGSSALMQWGLGALIGLFPLTVAGSHPAMAYRVALLTTASLTVAALAFYWPLLQQRRPA